MQPSTEPTTSPPQAIWTVSELTAGIKQVLESSFGTVWLTGEISNLSMPQSGHCYLTLKDQHAQIRAVIWKPVASRLRFELCDGLEVICQGELEVYAPRGTYQMVIRRIEPKGVGALELALRKLHEKLAAEGLFDPARKRTLPKIPRRIALVTSPTGAAVHDFLQVARRRFAGVDILVVPVRVQGDGAAAEIAAALERVNSLSLGVDCIVLARGGGSLEDLWAFNEEILVRAVYASRLPVVSGVGHEVDVTLTDMVADVRALTPSDAALRVVPEQVELSQLLAAYRYRLSSSLRRKAESARARLERAAMCRILRKPHELVRSRAQRLDELEAAISRAARQRLVSAQTNYELLVRRLEGLSPLAVLARGYSVTLVAGKTEPLRNADRLEVGQRLQTRFSRGEVLSRIEELNRDEHA